MVIAPLLGPNVALSFATTLGDLPLALRAIKINSLGILLVFIVFIWSFLLHVTPDMSGISSRISIALSDIVIALAAGSAGTLAFTTGAPAALIGVMVAVALLPPLIVFGLLCRSGFFAAGLGVFLVFLTNIICINLAGIVTFLLNGVRPLTWWESQHAQQFIRKAIALWGLMLVILIVLIVVSQHR